MQAVETLFAQFALLGTIGAVVRYFRSHHLLVPCRVMNGQNYGQVELRPPTYWRIRHILINPHYTDALVFARRTGNAAPMLTGRSPRPQPVQRPVNEWQIVREHHEAYVSWETFWRTQHHLKENQNKLQTTPRGGPALLSRLLYCGRCGYSMTIQYARSKGPVTRGYYQCRSGDVSVRAHCLVVAAACIDPPVVEAVLHVLAELTPQALAEALAHEHADDQQHHRLRAQTLKQVDAEVTAVERRYKAVDPANNLVFHQAEREYEEVLRRREQLQLAHAQDPLPAVSSPLFRHAGEPGASSSRCPQLVAACGSHEPGAQGVAARALGSRHLYRGNLWRVGPYFCIGRGVP